jgi:Mce-associated membrane protein
VRLSAVTTKARRALTVLAPRSTDDNYVPSPQISGNALRSNTTIAASDRTTNRTVEDSADTADDRDAEFDSLAKPRSPVCLAVIVGLVIVVTLAALAGWLGIRSQQSHQAAEQRQLFLQAGRQGAINLTSIDWQHVDGDVQRILESATGAFHDDFSKRSQPFVEVVKQAQSKSVGAVNEAGVESEAGNEAQVLVAVTVKTSTAGAAEQRPRSWRMRISVQMVGDEPKVSNVVFVP